VSNAVANITVSQSGANITRQRQNLQSTHIWGVQTDAQYQIAALWTISAAYVYDNAKVAAVADTASADAKALVGNYLPQVPLHRGTLQVAYANPRLATISVSLLAMSRQFDDDQNAIVVPGQSEPGLPAYGVVDLLVSRDLAHNVQVFGGAQNLFNQTYYAGTLPTLVGSPRIVSIGVRVKLQAH
jgi:outer membrane receptor protein involved in Fe transport